MSEPPKSPGRRPPGPRGRRLRNLRARTSDFSGFLTRLHEQYGDVVWYELPFEKCCVLFDPDLIRELLVEQEPFFRTWDPGRDDDTFFKYLYLCSHQGEEHRRRRRLFDTGFSAERLPGYAAVVIEESRALRGRCVPGRTVDLKQEMERFVWDSLVRIFIGKDIGIPRKLGLDMLAAGKVKTLLGVLPFSEFTKKHAPLQKRGQRAVAIVDRAIYAAIERARDPASDGRSLIAHFVRAVDKGVADWTYELDRALRDEVVATIGLFTDSPAASLVFGAYHIARNRSVRRRLEQEVDTVLGDRPLEAADFEKLAYTRALFNETLRVDPPAYAGLTKEAMEDRVIGGYLIPKGTVLQPGIGVLHRNAEHWDSPGEFRPERFLDGPEPGRPRCPEHAYMPFGAGPHACPAGDFAEMLFAFGLATITQSLRLDPAAGRPPRKENIGVGIRGAYRVKVSERRAPGRSAGTRP